MEWLNVNIAYWHWIVLGLALIGIELFSLTFYMVWIGASAIVVGMLSWVLPIPFSVQVLIWGALSIVCLVIWFKYFAPKMKDKTKSGMAMEALQGKIGTVLEFNSESLRGVLRFPAPLLGEDEWRFICEDKIVVGDRVAVKENSGNDLIVRLAK
jgi:hypothetical protein